MKHILLLPGAVTLLMTSGCIFPGHRGGGHGEYRGHEEYRGHMEYRAYPEPGVDVGSMQGSRNPPSQ